MKLVSHQKAHHDRLTKSLAPCVTVIVVNYNQDKYISQAIESILNQTFNDYEIIIIDDGSQDNSLNIIKKIIDQSSQKINFFSHKNNQNLGISRTYSLGISKARGKYIAFLEADDVWDENYLKSKVDILDQHRDVGVVFSKYKIVSENLYGYDMDMRQKIITMWMYRNRPFSNLKNLIKKNNVATFSAFVTRKYLLDNVSTYLPRHLYFLDWWILFQLSMHSKFYLDNSSIVYWRHYRRSTMGKQKMDDHKKQLSEFMNMMYEKIDKEYITLSRHDQLYYQKKKGILPYFNQFYTHPSIKNFFSFFRLDPVWALESMLSYLTSYCKYSSV